MEVADDRTHAGEVVGVEGDRAVLPFEGAGVAILGCRENCQSLAPAASWCPLRRMVPSLEKTVTAVFFKQDAAVVVADGSDSNQVVVKIGHDVSGGGGQVGEEDAACGGGEVGGAAGGADDDLERVGVYVGARDF